MVTSYGDRLFIIIVYFLLACVGLAAILPLMYVVSVSLTPYTEVLRNGGYVLLPKSFTLIGYQTLLKTSRFINSMQVTIFITVVGTAISLVLTTLLAYPLSRKSLPGRSVFLLIVVFTLLFSGGIIPTYLIVKGTGLLNSIWSLIIPSAISSFNVIVMKSFFEALSEELLENARMDGAGEWRILWTIIVPLSLPVLITIGLFYGVGQWNQFLAAIMYITKASLHPLQVVLREILLTSQNQLDNPDEVVPTVTMQMSAVVLASLPIIIVYPFLQRHFIRGIMLGSIKG